MIAYFTLLQNTFDTRTHRYVFAVLFVQAVNDFKLDPDNAKLPTRELEASDLYFSSLPDTMLSLFMCIAGGVNWGEVQSPLKAISTVWVVFFLFYVAFTLPASFSPSDLIFQLASG